MRATVLAIAAVLTTSMWGPLPAFAQDAEPEWRHATSLSETPRYAEGFTHFDYVNPDAPKGGRVRLADPSGYDSFNPLLSRGIPAPGTPLMYDTLMTPSADEEPISATYGLVAEAVRFPDDFSWVEYRINPDARFHDGTPVTVDDVIWSLEAVKSADPRYAFYYSDVTGAEAVDERTVRFSFARPGNRELPHIVGQLQILPKAWWTGTDASGAERSITSGTLEPPVGSGAYRIARFAPGRFIEYERVPDYWAADHPTQVGKNNFDTIRYDVFRDQTVLAEAFKGDRYDFRVENSAKAWATQYDFPASRDGRVIRELFADEARGGMQAFVLNLRLPKFQDQGVRRALNLAYDFEAQADTIFYGQYERTDSYFEGTELEATGLPEGRELAILEEVRDLIPASVFTEEYANPVGGDSQKVRENLREAVRLFREAGYELRDGSMVDGETGEPFTIEMIERSPTAERYVLPYQAALRRIGVELTLRIVDTSQYVNRIRNRDFEMTTLSFPQTLSPGNEQLDWWGSAAADRPESNNNAGIKDPGVDALIDKIILAKDREELVAASHALDRVLLAHDFMVPQFNSKYWRTIRWDRFGHPDNIPPYTIGFPTFWWFDEEKAAAVEAKS